MKVLNTGLPGVMLLQPELFGDERGFFLESFNRGEFERLLDLPGEFVQDNHSRSCKGVLRGLHYQIQQPQGKLVRVIRGDIFDVAVDLRRSSPNFGHWTGLRLNAEQHQQLWVPPGFGHGFLVISPVAEVLYKTTDYWAPVHERCIAWNDPELAIDWPLDGAPTLSGKDGAGVAFAVADVYE